MPASTLSRQFADFIGRDISRLVGHEIRRTVQIAFLDTAGCILSGRGEEVTRKLQAWLARHYAQSSEAQALFSGQRSSAGAAAMLNAVAGHAIDFDDVALAGHPSVVLVPALLAESERAAQAGDALIHAYVKGYQIWAELLGRLPPTLHETGWHPTAVLGTVAAAAALCALRGLDPGQTSHALGLAASRASGLVANFGSMAKPLHAGWAVEQGFCAVDLAELGITASADALDGPTGLLRALSGAAPRQIAAFDAAASELAITTVRPSIKKYPVCYAGHRVIDGIVSLREKYGLQAGQIERVEVEVSPTNARILKYPEPATALEAKFSMSFNCATALVRGHVGVQELVDATLADPQIRRIMPRVRVSTTEQACPLEPSFALNDRVRITLTDGTELDSGPIRFALGHADNPLSIEQVVAKVKDCAGGGNEALAAAVLSEVKQAIGYL